MDKFIDEIKQEFQEAKEYYIKKNNLSIEEFNESKKHQHILVNIKDSILQYWKYNGDRIYDKENKKLLEDINNPS